MYAVNINTDKVIIKKKKKKLMSKDAHKVAQGLIPNIYLLMP